jgi:hypothetical protein
LQYRFKKLVFVGGKRAARRDMLCASAKAARRIIIEDSAGIV